MIAPEPLWPMVRKPAVIFASVGESICSVPAPPMNPIVVAAAAGARSTEPNVPASSFPLVFKLIVLPVAKTVSAAFTVTPLATLRIPVPVAPINTLLEALVRFPFTVNEEFAPVGKIDIDESAFTAVAIVILPVFVKSTRANLEPPEENERFAAVLLIRNVPVVLTVNDGVTVLRTASTSPEVELSESDVVPVTEMAPCEIEPEPCADNDTIEPDRFPPRRIRPLFAVVVNETAPAEVIAELVSISPGFEMLKLAKLAPFVERSRKFNLLVTLTAPVVLTTRVFVDVEIEPIAPDVEVISIDVDPVSVFEAV